MNKFKKGDAIIVRGNEEQGFRRVQEVFMNVNKEIGYLVDGCHYFESELESYNPPTEAPQIHYKEEHNRVVKELEQKNIIIEALISYIKEAK